jgi:hypothetical protein
MNFAILTGAEVLARLRIAKSMSRAKRAMVLAFVFMAAGFVSLRPICELALGKYSAIHSVVLSVATGHATATQPDSGGTPSAICCANVGDGSLVKPAEALASWTQGGTQGTILFFSAGLLLFARSRYPAIRLLTALPERSFYTRSARILR